MPRTPIPTLEKSALPVELLSSVSDITAHLGAYAKVILDICLTLSPHIQFLPRNT